VGHTVIVQHLNGGASGQIYLAQDVNFTIDYIDKFVDFVRIGTNWIEINRCWGNDKTSAEYRTFYNLGTSAAIDYGTSANQIMRLNSSAQIPAVSGALLTGIERRGQYVLVEDQKTAMTDGGNSVADTNWHQRDLNTKVIDETAGAAVTVSSNRANLPAGTYYFRASAPCYSSSSHKIYVRQSTGAAIFYGPSGMMTEVYGTNPVSSAGNQTDSIASGKFILASSGSIEIWYRCTASQSTSGLGLHHGAGTSVYSRIEFWRVP
jgi:dihydroxyacetone kinase DhaKLM complex PTS-EIIA-like component DhaM